MTDNSKELQVAAIENGTVIDHIPSEKLFSVVSILKLAQMPNNITIGFNLESKKIGKKGMFFLFLGIAVVGMVMLYLVSIIEALRSQMWIVYVAQFVKSTGIIVATGYMWALVPEVVSYGEYTSGRRIAGIVNALTGIFFKAGMALGGVVPGLVLSIVNFNAKESVQTPLAEQGILWLVCVIPMLLVFLAMFIISKYELSDEKMDEINTAIEQRMKASGN